MANILPPEFFGLFGLGSELKQAGNMFGELKEQDRQKKLQELQLQAQLNPNQRQFLLQQAEAQGLLPPGSAAQFAATSGEMIESGTAGVLTGETPFESLTPGMQLGVGGQFQLDPGETPSLARRRVEAQTRGAEAQVDALEAAENSRKQYEEAINNPGMLKMLGLPEGTRINSGTVEAYKTFQGLTNENLTAALRSAQTDTERAQLQYIRAQTARVNADITRMNMPAGDETSLEWLKTMSLRTGHMPSMIQAAFDPKSQINDSLRSKILEDVNSYQNSLRADWQKTIREGTAGQTAKTLADLVQMHKNGIPIFEPDDPIWTDMTVQALNESGLPAVLVEKPSKFFGLLGGGTQLLVGEEAEQAMSAFDRAAEAVGSAAQPGRAPTIDAGAADQYAAQIIERQGGVEQALKFINDNQALEEGDRNLLRNAITKAGQTETPVATPPATPTAPTTPAAEPTIDEMKRELAEKTAEVERLREFTPPVNEPGIKKVERARQIRNLAADVNRLRSRIIVKERTQR